MVDDLGKSMSNFYLGNSIKFTYIDFLNNFYWKNYRWEFISVFEGKEDMEISGATHKRLETSSSGPLNIKKKKKPQGIIFLLFFE